MPRILIVDDEPNLRALLRRILEHEGHTVVEAPDGRHGLLLWRDQLIDLVLTDIYMPEKDGIELLVAIRKTRRPTKIICMTGASERGLLNLNPAAEIMGADRTLSKPFGKEALLSTIIDVLMEEGMATSGDPASHGKGGQRSDRIRTI